MESLTLANTALDLLEQLRLYATHPIGLAVALFIATFVSEDLACIAGGILAARGDLSLALAITGCGCGIWIGDIGLYGLGRLVAHGTKRWSWLQRRFSANARNYWVSFFEQWGLWWIMLTRILPGSRFPAYTIAGFTGWSFKKFAFLLAIAAAIWTPFLVGSSYWLGNEIVERFEFFQRHAWLSFGVIGVSILLITHVLIPSFSWKGRRRLLSRWRRLTRWEYWPTWAVYPPIALCLLWQYFRPRGGLFFTSCNPGIDASGFAMESKSKILEQLGDGTTQMAAAPWENLQGDIDARLAQIAPYLQRDGAAVLKPDVGERGQGVAIVRSEVEARAWLDACDGLAMVQSYIGGIEFGISWYRFPGAERGSIPSIVGKHPQSLIGDGEHTLEHLILSDDRAVEMSPYYLKKFAARLLDIPTAGEKISLTELGTHCRGAIFTDERSRLTDDLLHAVDAAVPVDSGLHFGRFDVRVPDVDALTRGEQISILELNGVTGEPAHIYQPGYSLFKGWADLIKHWRTANDIGRAQQEYGHQPLSFKQLWTLIQSHKKAERLEADHL